LASSWLAATKKIAVSMIYAFQHSGTDFSLGLSVRVCQYVTHALRSRSGSCAFCRHCHSSKFQNLHLISRCLWRDRFTFYSMLQARPPLPGPGKHCWACH
jgi:hypothetical protein